MTPLGLFLERWLPRWLCVPALCLAYVLMLVTVVALAGYEPGAYILYLDMEPVADPIGVADGMP